jgi:hypothetical protein
MPPRSQIVLADAQFGTARILRPPAGFEAIYDGESAGTSDPIYLFEGGSPLDPLAEAGQPGYDPDLIKGLAVPMGARIVVWVPTIVYVSDDGPLTFKTYNWSFGWRIRNLTDYRLSRVPWHLPRGRGPDDTAGATSEPRVVIPAGYNSIIFNQPEPTSALLPQTERAVNRGRAEDLQLSAVSLAGPLLDAGGTRGVVQQGIEDPAVVSGATRAGFIVHEMQALGDELIVAVYRDTSEVADWGFSSVGPFPANADFVFSRLLGSGTGQVFPDVGVYVFAGSAP